MDALADGNASTDRAAAGSGMPVDARGGAVTSVDASAGVTCITKRRVIDSCDGGTCTCSQATTTETNVKFWISQPSTSPDREHGIATDSKGMAALYLTFQADTPIWFATDVTHTKYSGYNPLTEYILRAGNVIDVYESLGRESGPGVAGCSAPFIEVRCHGQTALAK